MKIALLFFLLITHWCGGLASWATQHTAVCVDMYGISESHVPLSTPVNHSSSTDDSNDEPVATERGRKKTKSKKRGRRRSENTKSGLHSQNYEAMFTVSSLIQCQICPISRNVMNSLLKRFVVI